MTAHLFDHIHEIEGKVAGSPASGVLLLLDFDGTLARIAEEPHLAVLDPRVRKILVRLHRSPSVRLGVVSGRELRDVQSKVGVPDLVYAGNHGLEIEGPGATFVHPGVAGFAGLLREAAETLRGSLAQVPGVLVEDKRMTVCVHYRSAPPEMIPVIFEAARAAIEPNREQLRLTPGLKVINILPEIRWTKGEAVEWIRDVYRCRDYVPVYIGDDVTDEDAFRALRDHGITIRVGPSSKSLASYHVANPGEVEEFLEWLSEYIQAVTAAQKGTHSIETPLQPY